MLHPADFIWLIFKLELKQLVDQHVTFGKKSQIFWSQFVTSEDLLLFSVL